MFPYHGPVETVNFVTGILMNMLLLFVIRRFSRKELGRYKHLLTIFALQDIFLVLVQAFCNVTPYHVGTISGVVSRTFWESRRITSFYCAINALPFFLTNVNFLYRYWAIKRPEMLSLYSNKFFQGALVLLSSSAIFVWYLLALYVCTGDVDEPATIALRESFAKKYNLTICDGWIVMDHWRNNKFALRPFSAVFGSDIIMACALITQIVLSTMTFYYIRINTLVSESNRRSQRAVLIALCAQTLVPLLFVYIPYLNSINAPFFAIDDVMDIVTLASFISAFPVLDALVIILLMKDYRLGAMSFFSRYRNPKIAEVSSRTNASSVVSSSFALSYVHSL